MVVVVLVAMAVRTKFSGFFDGIVLSQKTHALLLASTEQTMTPMVLNLEIG